MIWFFIALFVACSEATKDIYYSQLRMRFFSPLLKAWVMSLTSLPVLFLVLWYHGVPTIQPIFWKFVLTHAVLMCVALILYMRALALGPLSQTQPILALTTVLLVLTNPLMTSERVTVVGWVGVVLIGLGIYATQHPGKDPETGKLHGFFSPFVEMIRQPGVFSKLGVAIIFSVTANIDRLALDASSGPFYLAVDSILVVLFLGGVLLLRMLLWRENGQSSSLPMRESASRLLLGGTINATTLLLHMWALTFTTVPYVIAVKRLSILFASTWGYLVRKERKPHWYRLAGMLGVVCGVMLILLFGKG